MRLTNSSASATMRSRGANEHGAVGSSNAWINRSRAAHRSMAHECALRQPSQSREPRPHLPIAAHQRQVPDTGVGIDHNRGHQMSSLGKFRHMSRRFSSISSGDREIPRSAHSPLTLLKGIFLPASSRNLAAWFRTSCCFSAGNARTASRIACSRDMDNLNPIIRRCRGQRKAAASTGRFFRSWPWDTSLSSTLRTSPARAWWRGGPGAPAPNRRTSSIV